MKIAPRHHVSARRSPAPRSRGAPAFTMIEIALAIGVIAIALVAIIGILPVGLNVQKDTHQDTIISQDGPFFLQSIRNGAPLPLINRTASSLDFLTNYIDQIAVTTYRGGFSNTVTFPIGSPFMTNGQQILGLLSTPEFLFTPPNLVTTNYVTAAVRALTGSALEQSGANTNVAFRYFMTVEVAPFISYSADSIDFPDYQGGTLDYITRSNRFFEVQSLRNNLFDVRLKFSWPILSLTKKTTGPGRQTLRALVSGRLLSYTNNGQSYWFFQPQSYTSTNL